MVLNTYFTNRISYNATVKKELLFSWEAKDRGTPCGYHSYVPEQILDSKNSKSLPRPYEGSSPTPKFTKKKSLACAKSQ